LQILILYIESHIPGRVLYITPSRRRIIQQNALVMCNIRRKFVTLKKAGLDLISPRSTLSLRVNLLIIIK